MIIREEKIQGGFDSANGNNVVFTVDKKFTFPLGVAITSVLLHNRDVHIHVFIDEFVTGEKEKLVKTAEKFSVPITIYYVDSTNFEKFPIRGDWSVAVYFRFLAADVLKSRYTRILYMDADVICQGSLQDLFQLDIEGKALAAVPDPTYLQNKDCEAYSTFIGHKGDGYFNAGIMLLNLQEWQNLRITENALAMLQNEPDRYIQAQDQDVLNVLFANKVYWLPEKYNTRNNIDDAYPDDTVLIHYSGSPKPWKAFYYSSAQCSPFMEAKEQSLWVGEALQMPTKTIEYQFMSRKHARTGRKWDAFLWQIKYIISKLTNS